MTRRTVIAALVGCPSEGGGSSTSSPAGEIDVYFSPRGGCRAAVVPELDATSFCYACDCCTLPQNCDNRGGLTTWFPFS